MAIFKFNYGIMSSGKSLRLLVDYSLHKKTSLVCLAAIPNTKNLITSRINLEQVPDFLVEEHETAESFIEKITESMKEKGIKKLKNVFVDEAQFVNAKFLPVMKKISRQINVNFFFYGLKSDFQTNLFPPTTVLFEIADELEHIEGICIYCQRNPSNYNIRYDKKKKHEIFEGNTNQLPTDEITHNACCYDCKDKLYKKAVLREAVDLTPKEISSQF